MEGNWPGGIFRASFILLRSLWFSTYRSFIITSFKVIIQAQVKQNQLNQGKQIVNLRCWHIVQSVERLIIEERRPSIMIFTTSIHKRWTVYFTVAREFLQTHEKHTAAYLPTNNQSPPKMYNLPRNFVTMKEKNRSP